MNRKLTITDISTIMNLERFCANADVSYRVWIKRGPNCVSSKTLEYEQPLEALTWDFLALSSPNCSITNTNSRKGQIRQLSSHLKLCTLRHRPIKLSYLPNQSETNDIRLIGPH